MGTILVAKNNDEPLMFEGMGAFFAWLVEHVASLSQVTDFLSGGVLEDKEGNTYALMDL